MQTSSRSIATLLVSLCLACGGNAATEEPAGTEEPEGEESDADGDGDGGNSDTVPGTDSGDTGGDTDSEDAGGDETVGADTDVGGTDGNETDGDETDGDDTDGDGDAIAGISGNHLVEVTESTDLYLSRGADQEYIYYQEFDRGLAWAETPQSETVFAAYEELSDELRLTGGLLIDGEERSYDFPVDSQPQLMRGTYDTSTQVLHLGWLGLRPHYARIDLAEDVAGDRVEYTDFDDVIIPSFFPMPANKLGVGLVDFAVGFDDGEPVQHYIVSLQDGVPDPAVILASCQNGACTHDWLTVDSQDVTVAVAALDGGDGLFAIAVPGEDLRLIRGTPSSLTELEGPNLAQNHGRPVMLSNGGRLIVGRYGPFPHFPSPASDTELAEWDGEWSTLAVLDTAPNNSDFDVDDVGITDDIELALGPDGLVIAQAHCVELAQPEDSPPTNTCYRADGWVAHEVDGFAQQAIRRFNPPSTLQPYLTTPHVGISPVTGDVRHAGWNRFQGIRVDDPTYLD